jgi:beta-fructofuranosidase
MLITARANNGPDDDRGVIGHAVSPDLHRWAVRPPLSRPGSGFGHIECPQLATVEDRQVMLFSCLDPQFSAARRGTGAAGGILYVPVESPTGPFDIAAASPLTSDAFYCGRIVQDRSGQAVLLAFHYFDQTRQFQGELSDPMPVSWENGELKVMTGTGRRRGRPRRGWPGGGRGGAR